MLNGRVMTADLSVVPPEDRSPLDELRDLYRQDAQPRQPLELAVPATQRRIVIRYGAPDDRSKLSAVFRAVQSGGVMDDYADVDLVVDCCKDILRVAPDGVTLLPLLGDDDRPVTFSRESKRLTEALGIDYVTEREAARKLFKDDEYPLSIAGHFQSLVAWLQRPADEAIERVEGNLPAPSAG
jgi:hypothetical protein